jgi:hypothetical protein
LFVLFHADPGVGSIKELQMARYIVADHGWSHIWMSRSDDGSPIEVERSCRFVLDRERLCLLHVDIDVEGKWVVATPAEAQDLLDSLVHGNPDLVDDPDIYGLEVRDSLPTWYASLA